MRIIAQSGSSEKSINRVISVTSRSGVKPSDNSEPHVSRYNLSIAVIFFFEAPIPPSARLSEQHRQIY